MVLMEHPDRRVRKDCREIPDHKDQSAQPELMVPMELMALTEHPVLRDHKEYQELMVLMVLMERRDLKEIQGI